MDDSNDVRLRAEETLRRYWGYDAFRPHQWDIIGSVLQGRDVLAVLPTGGGKSICYQLPALLQPGLTVVVSPLVALMHDQVSGLVARGIPAAFLHADLSAREIDQRWTDAEFGRYRLLYMAPERFRSDMFLARAGRLKVSLLAVDEAHCISEWGHDFRPAYLEIRQAHARLGAPPIVATTATATREVRRDIEEHLGLRNPVVHVHGFDRPNIIWSIFETSEKRTRMLDVVRGVGGSGIVYCDTRRTTEETARWLEQQGIPTACYHAGMPAAARALEQNRWMHGERRVMVATTAFGMGIDKLDVRFVVHLDLPPTLEAYYQEAGRAGRDGMRAYAVLLFQRGDERRTSARIAASHPDAGAVRKVYDVVCNLAQIPVGSLPTDPVTIDLSLTARVAELPDAVVPVAVDLLERQGAWRVLPVQRMRLHLRMLQPADALRRYAAGLRNQGLAAFLDDLVRTVHADAYSGWWEVDERLLRSRTHLSAERLRKGLDFLRERGLISWQTQEEALRVVLTHPRAGRLPVDDAAVRRALRRAETRQDHLLRYAHSVGCRRHLLLHYFGEDSPAHCGRCDVCLGRHRGVEVTSDDEPVMRQLLALVRDGVPRATWTGETLLTEQRLDDLLRWLVQEEFLTVKDAFTGTYAVSEKALDLLEQWKPR